MNNTEKGLNFAFAKKFKFLAVMLLALASLFSGVCFVSNKKPTSSVYATDVAVTFDANGGTIASDDSGYNYWTVTNSGANATKQVVYGSTYDTLPTVTRTGYSFDSWKLLGLYNSGSREAGTSTDNFGNVCIATYSTGLTAGTIALVEINDFLCTNGATTQATLLMYNIGGTGESIYLGTFNLANHVTIPITVKKTYNSECKILLFFGLRSHCAGVEYSNFTYNVFDSATSITTIIQSSTVGVDSNHILVAKWNATNKAIISNTWYTLLANDTTNNNGFAKGSVRYIATSVGNFTEIPNTATEVGHTNYENTVYATYNSSTYTVTFYTSASKIFMPSNSERMFYAMYALREFYSTNFDTSEVTSMLYMFGVDIGLQTLNLSFFNTEHVTSMYAMFESCSSLTTLNLSNFDMSVVNNAGHMLYNLNSLEVLYTPINVTCDAIFKTGSNQAGYTDVYYYDYSDNYNYLAYLPKNTAVSHELRKAAPTFTVTLNLNGGSVTNAQGWELSGDYYQKNVTLDSAYGTFPTLTKTGYTFEGWYDNAECTGSPITESTTVTKTTDHTLYANWTPNTNTAYTVNHYLQYAADRSRYALSYTDNLTGTTGASVNATPKTLSGFSHNTSHDSRVESGTIAGNGSLVLKVYYDILSYNVTFNAMGGTIANGDDIRVVNVDGTSTYGQNVNIYYPSMADASPNPENQEAIYTNDYYSNLQYISIANNMFLVNSNKSGVSGSYYINWMSKPETLNTVDGKHYTYIFQVVTKSNDNYLAIIGQTSGDLTAKFNNGGSYVTTGTISSTGTKYVQLVGNTAESYSHASRDYIILTNKNITTTFYVLLFAGKVTSANYSSYITPGSTINMDLPVPTREGYVFAGWYDNEGCTGSPVTESTIVSTASDHTLYAKWTANEYTITFNNGKTAYMTANPANMPSSTTYYTNNNTGTSTDQLIAISSPTATAYTFAGWSVAWGTGENGGTLPSVSGTTLTILGNTYGNIVVTATWTADSYDITYSLNSGNMTGDNPQSYTIEDVVTLATATRGGYTFGGWKYTAANAGGWEQNHVYTGTLDAGKYGDVTLTAQWTAKQYNITFSNGKTAYMTADPANMPSSTSYYTNNNTGTSTDQLIAISSPTATAYEFAGWSVAWGTGENGGTLPSVSGTTLTILGNTYGNIVVTATWTADSYDINYSLNGGSMTGDNPQTYTIEDAVTLATPTRSGYTFGGWLYSATTAGGWTQNQVYTGTLDAGKYGDITLTAGWTATQYKITFNTNGGNSISLLTYTIESTDVLPLPTKAGYIFKHWVVTTAGGNWEADATFANGIAVTGKWGNVTLTANWQDNGTLTIVSSYDTTGSDACDSIAMGFIDLTINGKVINLMLFSGTTYTLTHLPYDVELTYVASATVNHTAKVGANSTGTVTLDADGSSETITVTITKTGYGTLHTSNVSQEYASGVSVSANAAHTAKAIKTLKAMGIDLQYTDNVGNISNSSANISTSGTNLGNAINKVQSGISTLSTEQIALIVVASILMVIGTTEIVIAKCTKPKRRCLMK